MATHDAKQPNLSCLKIHYPERVYRAVRSSRASLVRITITTLPKRFRMSVFGFSTALCARRFFHLHRRVFVILVERVVTGFHLFRRLFLPVFLSVKVVMEVRKSAEKDAGALLEGLEVIRRAVIAEGCYPYRLVRVDMEAGKGGLNPFCTALSRKKAPPTISKCLVP